MINYSHDFGAFGHAGNYHLSALAAVASSIFRRMNVLPLCKSHQSLLLSNTVRILGVCYLSLPRQYSDWEHAGGSLNKESIKWGFCTVWHQSSFSQCSAFQICWSCNFQTSQPTGPLVGNSRIYSKIHLESIR